MIRNNLIDLDPAGSGFDKDETIRLHHYDANYVKTLHTSQIYDTKIHNESHANIIIEGGKVQPGCGGDLSLMCNHERAYYLFKLIFFKSGQFKAHKDKLQIRTLEEFHTN